MRKKRRIEINSFSERTIVVRKHGYSAAGWCSGCFSEVRMVTPDEAAAVAQVNTRMIYRWVEDSLVHFTEEAGGTLLICLDSLPLNLEVHESHRVVSDPLLPDLTR